MATIKDVAKADVTLDVVLRYIRLRGELPEGTDDFGGWYIPGY